ncbi:hypothetical protein C1J03_02715 [Sulfitobacter sp. SK012]|uniref:hypothetical protein n=1 Tax=Sulfitobacter sp. SK012 TaxID=1389005 RepID=UPI000E0C4D7B|nr:hypothetical protein [Sulfitobacter sp. SK012]AXI45040.1 hypothetical protein C1J03_02715 [Sulfitobacter sp. SK012]
MLRFLIFFLVLPFASLAAEFAVLKDDVILSREEVTAVTQRHLLSFYEGGQSRYSSGGAYSYTYDGGATAFGTYQVDADGVVCITFRNGRSRCDRFVHSHGRLVMVTEAGDRFAIRP